MTSCEKMANLTRVLLVQHWNAFVAICSDVRGFYDRLGLADGSLDKILRIEFYFKLLHTAINRRIEHE